MNELLEALILGVVQGLTEFLPVSSSGHLEIMKYLMNDDSLAEQSMMTTVLLHFATALATIVVFRKDIVKILAGLISSDKVNDSKKFAVYVLMSMIPAAMVGVFLDDWIEKFFHREIILVSCMLLVTGVILFVSERAQDKGQKLNTYSAITIGISQAIAILPGISRSGATISTALLLGVSRSEAARFSFLMVIPLIFGKIAKDLITGDLVSHMPSAEYLTVGFLAAFITGILACTLMIELVNRAKLSWFAFYCFIVGLSMIGYNLFIG